MNEPKVGRVMSVEDRLEQFTKERWDCARKVAEASAHLDQMKHEMRVNDVMFKEWLLQNDMGDFLQVNWRKVYRDRDAARNRAIIRG